ncbi:MAG: hypothetical protein R3C14_25975 [Caldilineaceae bacterium]
MIKRDRRSLPIISLALTMILLLAGCAPRISAGKVAANASPDTFYLDLPAILVQYDAQGEATVFNRPVSELGAILGTDLSALSLSADTIGKMTAGKIQHIQIDNQPNVLRIYMNSNPLPAIIWDEEAMSALAETLSAMGTDAGPLSALAPLLPNLGVGLALQMPVPSGTQAIPLQPVKGATLTSDAALKALAAAKATQPSINLTLDYDAAGNVTIGGIAPFMLNMIGLNPAALALPPDQIKSIADQGIQSLGVTTVQGGLLLRLNGNTLPYLQWSSADEITNLLSLAGAMAGPDMASQLQQLQLIFNFPGLSATVNFPQS